MENSSSLEASDGVLKSDCNNILPDLNATLLDASVDSPPPISLLQTMLIQLRMVLKKFLSWDVEALAGHMHQEISTKNLRLSKMIRKEEKFDL